MITVKLFGLLRLDLGIKELEIDNVSKVSDIYPVLLEKAKEFNPKTKVTIKDLEGAIVIINGKQIKKTYVLKDEDVVHLMSPVCGG